MSVILTKAGEELILKNLAKSPTEQISIDGYKVGDESGFEPTQDEKNVRGNVVFDSKIDDGALPLKFRIIDQDQLHIFTEFASDVGVFQIGNIGLFSGETLVALQVLSTPYTKVKQPNNQGDLVQFQAIIIAKNISVVFDNKTINTTVETFESLQICNTRKDLPEFTTPSNNTFIINDYEDYNTSIKSAIAFKDEKNKKWQILGETKEFNIFNNFKMNIR